MLLAKSVHNLTKGYKQYSNAQPLEVHLEETEQFVKIDKCTSNAQVEDHLYTPWLVQS